MINKVKPPAALKLVHSSKEAKNNLGGESSESYSQQSDPSKDPPSDSSASSTPEGSPPDPEQIQDQLGLTIVVKEWLEGPKSSQSISRARLSTKYQGESAPAKGMLLNKKIS